MRHRGRENDTEKGIKKINTFTEVIPTVTSRPISAGPKRSPDFNTTSPLAISQP